MSALIPSAAAVAPAGEALTAEQLRTVLADAFAGRGDLRRVLLLPPDHTRLHSGAGLLCRILWELLTPGCEVDIMPALGTHVPMTEAEWREMFGGIPYARMLRHDWRRDTVRLGGIPGAVLEELSEGMMRDPVPVELNRRILDPGYDMILSVGQVVPHEVVGMANRNKNLFVGCGGPDMINASHMLGALYGLERIMGRDRTPVRRLFDLAEERFLGSVPVCYLLTVTTAPAGEARIHGLFIGRERARFEEAVRLSRQYNVFRVPEPFRTCVVRLDEGEFRSTWLGNKAVYRTRMAMADGGGLFVLAPGVERFGEDPAIDALIRSCGYTGRDHILRLIREREDLRGSLSAAAHLIHGSSDGRFQITYCTKRLTGDEIRGAGYGWMDYDEAVRRFDADRLRPGMNPGGVYYIDNPALGLWTARDLND